MEVGQELSIQEVRDLLAGKTFRRHGRRKSPRDSSDDAQRNFESGASVDVLLPDNFSGTIRFNRVTIDGVVCSDLISSVRTASYRSIENGKFYYQGQRPGY